MSRFAVIDTETTWTGDLMTVGILIVERGSFEIADYRYYLVKEALYEGGMYSHKVHMKGIKEVTVSANYIQNEIYGFLIEKGISSVFAYNAGFDRKCLPALNSFRWYDIMRLAAYKQYNAAIPQAIDCYATGRLKTGYSVEGVMRLFGKHNYVESHNALLDARDELEIMFLLGYDLNEYPEMKT